MNLIGPARDRADGAHRRMNHHGVAGGDTEGAKPVSELCSGKHPLNYMRDDLTT